MDVSLSYIADILTVNLTQTKGKIEGERRVSIASSIAGLSMPATIKVCASFAGEQTGAVAHIKGDLFILAAHNKAKGGGASSAFILDGSKLKPSWVGYVSACPDLRAAVDFLRGAIVAAYYRKPDTDWAHMNLTL